MRASRAVELLAPRRTIGRWLEQSNLGQAATKPDCNFIRDAGAAWSPAGGQQLSSIEQQLAAGSSAWQQQLQDMAELAACTAVVALKTARQVSSQMKIKVRRNRLIAPL
jgi:hypothetical protein